MHRILVASLPLAAALLVAFPARAENYGRVTRPHEQVTTEITSASDVDDFVFDGAPGWQLKAVVKKAKTGDLAPVLELVAPDGGVEVVGTSSSKAASIKKALLAEEGRYALRVRGASGTGAYTLSWSLKPDKGVKVKKESIGAGVTRDFAFAGAGGGLVSWALKYTGDGGAQVVSILDPDGTVVPFDGDAVIRKGTSEKAKDVPLTGGGGFFALRVRNDFAPVELSLSIKVKLPKEKKAKLSLSSVEPALEGLEPATGGCGTPVTVTGTGLGSQVGTLLMGGRPLAGLALTGGTTLTGTVTAGSGGGDVVYTAADGQVAVLPGAFSFLPVHTVQSFSPEGGSGGGGQLITIKGINFRTDMPGVYDVLVGGTPAPGVTVVDANTITCVTPAHVAGTFPVVVQDDCGQASTAPTQYTYGLPPFINFLSPNASPTFGGIDVLVVGANLAASDKVYLDGVLMTSTPLLFQGAVIGHSIVNLPAHAVGKVDVEVRAASGQSAVKVDALAYYGFTDITSTAIPPVAGTEDWGGNSAVLIDSDRDGDVDVLVVAHPAGLGGTRPGVRALTRNGSNVFTDATSTIMPAATAQEGYGANRVCARSRGINGPVDLYLSRPGTGSEAVTLTSSSYEVIPWGRLLFPDGGGVFQSQPINGQTSVFAIPGIPHCSVCGSGPKCYLFDYDFRSVTAATGDLDGDMDDDVVLLNNVSINRFKGTGAYAAYIGCNAYVAQFSGFQTYTFGSAVRFCTTGSSGGITDQTKALLDPTFSADEDFRGVGLAIVDMTGDGLRDVVVTHNVSLPKPGGSNHPATRVFRQRNLGVSVVFQRMTTLLPVPASASADDWRGDTVAGGDLNVDLRADLVVSLDGSPPVSGGLSTRILVRHPVNDSLEDQTSAVLAGVLPSGDDGRAAKVLIVDLDKDGDQDILLATPSSVGTGNRRTRYLMNIGPSPTTGLPRFRDASSLFPAAALEPGNAVDLLVSDIDGDGDLDIILVDTHVGGTSGRRVRVFRQDR